MGKLKTPRAGAGGVVQRQRATSKGPRPRGSKGRRRLMSQVRQSGSKCGNPAFLQFFVPFKPSTDEFHPVHFTQSTSSDANVFPNGPHRDTPEITFNQLRGPPVVQSSGHITLTITLTHHMCAAQPGKIHSEWRMVFASGENKWGWWGQGGRETCFCTGHPSELFTCFVLFFNMCT